ncbi:MAG TPA: type II toxin-antitoxin system VapC family toxin [Stellaceae bacterium]|nr:type II toxin-antitoxin system VapC family toxin [Stellaceae bacterium]
MSLYLDTSLLVSALTAEREGSRIEAWIRSNSSDDFAISDWVVTEFSAALSMKLRTQQVDLAQRATALSLFSGFCIEKATVLPVEHQHFSAAARLADRYDAGIRAGDALHLAVAADHGATLCTLDRRLSDAGPSLGIATLLV